MRTARLALLSLMLWGIAPGAAPRPSLGNGSCLACHRESLPVLPSRPCIACHAKNMEFLEGSACHDSSASFWLLAGVGCAGLLALAGLGLLGLRRAGPLGALLCITALASPGLLEGGAPPLPGAFLLARGRAGDLGCVFSPKGDSALFQRSGSDKQGAALFLWRRGAREPVRLTEPVLDFSGLMAAWSPDGSRFAVPVPLRDTNGDGAVTRIDRMGLVLFDASGRRLAELAPGEHDMVNPAFSRDGKRVAFSEGAAIGLWDLETGRRLEVLEALPGGAFPRLIGWDPQDRRPVFTRGYEYAVLDRDESARYAIPEEIPLEAAEAGRAIVLTPPGTAAVRRSRGQPFAGGIGYLGQESGGARGLYVFDGARERRWTPRDCWIYAFEPCPSGGFWVLASEGPGKPARLARVPGPGEMAPAGRPMAAHLLGLAGGQSPLACGPGLSGSGRCLQRRTGSDGSETEAVRGGFFAPSAAGEACSVVLVREDSDGDGELTPMDEGELWMRWSAP